MIQALNTNMIDPKALTGAKGNATGEGQNIDPELMLENADFANELMASLGEGEETKLEVKPVEVSPEMMMRKPSSLINLPESGQPESINPKVFDPALTRGVEKLIQPKTAEAAQTITPTKVQLSDLDVLKLAKGEAVEGQPSLTLDEADFAQPEVKELKREVAQALLKQPQIPTQATQAGRSPAIDFAKTEIDPQLLNLEDFVAQKNLVSKKPAQTSAYGMPKVQMQKAGLESDLKSTQIINELPASESGLSSAGTSVNSQQFILSSMMEQPAQKVSDVQTPAQIKTFDMSQLKTENPNQIMTQVSDYIVQAKAAKEPTVNLRMNHDELGIIDITVHKASRSQDAIAINIGAHSADGKNFFQQNSKELFSHLTNAGINVADFKVETPSQTARNDFDMGNQSGRQGQGSERQFGSEQNQRRHESERRQDLWNLLKDKEAA